ncbi:MAG: alpha/beta hydrolase [Muribaculaceae bacterium]|nr:alpha/beta hydrolase [Muribaculaceae bacterium]
MKKVVFSVLASLTLLTGSAQLHKNFYPSEEEAAAMLIEADDFIDSMPDGFQDRQADAIYHAIRGRLSELEKFRGNKNAIIPSSDSVKIEEINGSGDTYGIRMLLYTLKDNTTPLPLLIYFHGGGWCAGGISSSSSFCESLAKTGKAIVLSVDYPLAPENPFPSAILRCRASIEYAASRLKDWNASSLNVGGDGAGGNLALASTLSLLEAGKEDSFKTIGSLVLYYPIVKSSSEKIGSWKKFARGYGLDSRLMEAYVMAYLSSTPQNNSNDTKANALISPILADDEILKRLPTIFIINAERDILLDQGREFSERLKSLGIKVEPVVFPGAVHSFVTNQGQQTAFSKAVSLTAAFLSSIDE